MSDITAWLTAHSLEELADTFVSQDIDTTILAALTEADLKELGLSVGLRRKVLRAIRGQLNSSLDALYPDPDHSADHVSSADIAEAEHRQITVLFCDLVDATSLSVQFDDEDYNDCIQIYRRCCGDVAERFSGTIAQYMGDGILILFGYPYAHENDAERAVLAALEIAQLVPRLSLPSSIVFHVRIGVATGTVVAADLLRGGVRDDQAIVGETPNLAARLQAVAPTNSVVISERSHLIAGRLFECTDLGARRLRGFTKPERVWQVHKKSALQSRFDALRSERLSKLIGRLHELALLLERWEQASQGDGQVVLLSGEPGIGKSRLVQALRERMAQVNHTCLSYYCSPHRQTSILYPIVSQFEYSAGITPEDNNEQKLHKIEQLQRRSRMPVADTVPLWASLMSVPVSLEYARLSLTPAELKSRTLQVLIARLEELSTERPILCIFEDVHWIDPTSRELVAKVLEAIRTMPILLIITHRLGFDESSFDGYGHTTRLSLNRLTRSQSELLVRQRAVRIPLEAPLLDTIVAKSDGIPLYLEELTDAVIETNERSAVSGYSATADGIIVPATLYDSLMARLDKMATAKRIVQMAAVIGRTSPLDLLKTVSGLSTSSFQDAIEKLVEAGIFLKSERSARTSLRFKHALLQDIAYQSLMRPTKQRYHEQVARKLEEISPDLAESQPELLAYHYTESGNFATAVEYWLAAGKRSTSLSANLEAVSQIEKGFALLNKLDEPELRLRMELALSLAVLAPLIATKGYGSSELEARVTRALEISRSVGRLQDVFPAWYNRFTFYSVTGDVNIAAVGAEEALKLARDALYDEGIIVAGRCLGSNRLFAGRPEEAMGLLSGTLASCSVEDHRSSAFTFGQDHIAVCASYLSLTLWYVGRFEEAKAHQELAISRAREVGHLNTLCLTLSFAGGFLNGLCRKAASTQVFAAEILELAEKHALPVWLATGTALMGHAVAENGNLDDGIIQMQAGIAALEQINIKVFRTMFASWLAAACCRCNRLAEARAALADAWSVSRGGETWMDVELHRIEGELALLATDVQVTEAECSFQTALSVAREQRAKALEIRVSVSLARLWRTQGKYGAARDLLAKALLLEDGLTVDSMAAKELLLNLRN